MTLVLQNRRDRSTSLVSFDKCSKNIAHLQVAEIAQTNREFFNRFRLFSESEKTLVTSCQTKRRSRIASMDFYIRHAADTRHSDLKKTDKRSSLQLPTTKRSPLTDTILDITQSNRHSRVEFYSRDDSISLARRKNRNSLRLFDTNNRNSLQLSNTTRSNIRDKENMTAERNNRIAKRTSFPLPLSLPARHQRDITRSQETRPSSVRYRENVVNIFDFVASSLTEPSPPSPQLRPLRLVQERKVAADLVPATANRSAVRRLTGWIQKELNTIDINAADTSLSLPIRLVAYLCSLLAADIGELEIGL